VLDFFISEIRENAKIGLFRQSPFPTVSQHIFTFEPLKNLRYSFYITKFESAIFRFAGNPTCLGRMATRNPAPIIPDPDFEVID
jgi:hypothetical protein